MEILLIALGLAMDAFAVSIVSGAAMRRIKVRNALKMALFFGLFQAVMPLAGWLAGHTLRNYIGAFDHWIAFGLLTIIGGRMVYGSFRLKEDSDCAGSSSCPFDTGTLTMLSLATSIDAMAVGITFSMLSVSVLLPVAVIGAVTFVLSGAGVYIGARGGHLFESRVEAAGGLILIGIGLKILLEHTGYV